MSLWQNQPKKRLGCAFAFSKPNACAMSASVQPSSTLPMNNTVKSHVFSIRVYLALKRGIVQVYARKGTGDEILVQWGLNKPDPQESGQGWQKLDIATAMVCFRNMFKQALEADDEKFTNDAVSCLCEIEKWAERTAVRPELEVYVDQCIAQEKVIRKKDFCLGMPFETPPSLARKAFDAYLHQIPTTKRTFSKVKKSAPAHTKTHHQASPKKPATKPKRRATGPKRIWVQFVQGGAPGLGKRA